MGTVQSQGVIHPNNVSTTSDYEKTEYVNKPIHQHYYERQSVRTAARREQVSVCDICLFMMNPRLSRNQRVRAQHTSLWYRLSAWSKGESVARQDRLVGVYELCHIYYVPA